MQKENSILYIVGFVGLVAVIAMFVLYGQNTADSTTGITGMIIANTASLSSDTLVVSSNNEEISYSTAEQSLGCRWTGWKNRDSPSDMGDDETIAHFIDRDVCKNPVAIECKTLSGVSYKNTGQITTCNTEVGFSCYNSKNPKGCLDYTVRFCCPGTTTTTPTTPRTPDTIPTTPRVACTDSDGGKDYNVKGTLTATTTQGTKTDYCVGGSTPKKLAEYYCSGSSGTIQYYNCPTGCKDGACVSNNTISTCTDSDGALNVYEISSLYIKGTTSYNGETFIDACETDIYGHTELREYHCVGDSTQTVIRGELETCVNGCSNGACVQATTNNDDSYPGFLFDSSYTWKGQIVVGELAPYQDVVYATDIAASLQKFASDHTGGVITPIATGMAVLDKEASTTKPLVIINSPCVNTVAAKFMNNPTQCSEGQVSGIGRIDFLTKNGQQAVMVSGYQDINVKQASRVLAQWSTYKSYYVSGKSLCVKNTGTTTFTVYACDPIITETTSTCTDSDGGYKPNVYGTADIGDYAQADYCDYYNGQENYLLEAVCENGAIVQKAATCSGSTPYCYEGACSTKKPTCDDSDGGNLPAKLGTVVTHNFQSMGPSTDYCATTNDVSNYVESCSGSTCIIREFYCSGLGLGYSDTVCAGGCNNGVCGSNVETTLEVKSIHMGAADDGKVEFKGRITGNYYTATGKFSEVGDKLTVTIAGIVHTITLISVMNDGSIRFDGAGPYVEDDIFIIPTLNKTCIDTKPDANEYFRGTVYYSDGSPLEQSSLMEDTPPYNDEDVSVQVLSSTTAIISIYGEKKTLQLGETAKFDITTFHLVNIEFHGLANSQNRITYELMSVTDFCSADDKFENFYCGSNGVVDTKEVTCQNSCENGACVGDPIPEFCTTVNTRYLQQGQRYQIENVGRTYYVSIIGNGVDGYGDYVTLKGELDDGEITTFDASEKFYGHIGAMAFFVKDIFVDDTNGRVATANICFDINPTIETPLTLADYPQPFITKDGIATGLFVVGKNAALEDVIGITDIIASLQLYAGDNPFPVGLVKFDDAVTDNDLYNRDVILVGGMCANTAVAKMYGEYANCAAMDTPGVGHIKIIRNKNTDKKVLLIHGYSAVDTTMATRVLAKWDDFKDEFESTGSLCVTGTLNNMLVQKCADDSGEPGYIIPKTGKPVVELFVMSYCPYGIQAEKGILPAVSALGSKIDFKIRFVNYAMHGEKEVKENLNQYCIQKNEPNKYLKYLACFLNDGAGQGSDAVVTSCLASAGIDIAKLNACKLATDTQFNVMKDFNDQSLWLNGNFPKFEIDGALNTKYGIGGSPILIINGATSYAGRDSASYLKEICVAFNNAPAECQTVLSSTQPKTGFG